MASISPFLVLQARAEARAILFCEGEFATLEAALAPLFDYAIDSGVFDQIGEADTKQMIEAPFIAALAPPSPEAADGNE